MKSNEKHVEGQDLFIVRKHLGPCYLSLNIGRWVADNKECIFNKQNSSEMDRWRHFYQSMHFFNWFFQHGIGL
jgi:hypothetical protein